MANNTIGAYHLSDNPALYEPARSNTFEFVVTGFHEDFYKKSQDFLRAGYTKDDTNARIESNAEELLRVSVVSSTVPTFSQEPIVIRRGNSVMKAAGVPTFNEGSLVINDYIGADGKSILMAWQNLSYDVRTEKVGRMKDYKKQCYLIEYTPDCEVVRTWVLKGCWVQALNMPDFNQEDGGKRQVTATIQYDSAYMEMPKDED